MAPLKTMSVSTVRATAKSQKNRKVTTERPACGAPPGLDLPIDDIMPPPGLEVPPGLLAPPGLGAPPGLEAPRPSEVVGFKVQVSGLEPRMLNNLMVECMLEQAGVEEAVECTDIKQGKLFVTFSDIFSAQLCMQHIHGFKWNSGTPPVATLVKTPAPPALPVELSADALAFTPSKTMSADAPVFVPTPCKAMSAEAPEFVMPTQPLTESAIMKAISSFSGDPDASTNAGDSETESCDDKATAVASTRSA